MYVKERSDLQPSGKANEDKETIETTSSQPPKKM